MTMQNENDGNTAAPGTAPDEHGTFHPAYFWREIWRVDFMRQVMGVPTMTLGSQDPSGNAVELFRLVEPATSPRLVLEIALVRPDGSKGSIEVPWNNIAAIHWKTGG